MTERDATELAYKNGYEKGYQDGLSARGVSEIVYAKTILTDEVVSVMLTVLCSRCKCHMMPTDNVCPGCGAIMRKSK